MNDGCRVCAYAKERKCTKDEINRTEAENIMLNSNDSMQSFQEIVMN